MRFLWAPWRMDYILGKQEKGCLFCKKKQEGMDEVSLILYQGQHAFVMMNKFPYNNGHLMVVPRRHCLELDQLNEREFQELFYLLKLSTKVIRKSLHPHGFNIGVNIGKAGGAGEKHLHFHIVPRWTGDTNFMPIFGETKVIPEHLIRSYQQLHSAFEKSLGRKRSRRGD